jgi:hypothetical protein
MIPAAWIAASPANSCDAIAMIRSRASGPHRAITSFSGVPCARSMTRNGWPSHPVPWSSARTTLGCDTARSSRASSASRAAIP